MRPNRRTDVSEFRKSFLGPMRETLAIKLYRAWALGSLLSLTGFWAQRVAVAWLIWEQTGSTTWVAIGVSADFLPVVLVSPIAGVLGDTFDRLSIVIWAQALTTIVGIVLCVIVLTGSPPVLLVVAIVALGGIGHGIRQPSRMAMIRDIMPAGNLPTAIAIGSILYNVARFTGPAAAGLIIATLGTEYVFLASSVTAVMFLVILGRMRRDVPRKIRGSGSASTGFVQGFGVAMANPLTASILLLQLANTVCIRSFSEILPGVSDRVFDMGVEGLAFLTTSFAAGAIIGGLWLAQRSGIAGLYRVVLICNLASAVALSITSFVDVMLAAMFLLVLLGATITMCSIGSQTLLQTLAPDGVVGRVLATFGIVQWAGPAIGALIIGALSDRYGFPIPLLGASIAALVAAALLWFAYHAQWKQMRLL